MGGTSSDYGLGIAVASNGSVYTTGPFGGLGDFDPTSGTYNLTQAGGVWDMFVEKFSVSSHTIGDRVWLDANGNGVQDATEGSVAGVAVQLYSTDNNTIGDSDDVLQGTAITDANGTYSITTPTWPDGGSFYLVFRAPVGYAFTSQYAGNDRTIDSDANTSGVTGLFTLNAGQNDLTRDAGLLGAPPGFGWAVGVGSTSGDFGNAVATDSSGNVYVTGSFSGTVDFDPGPRTYNLTSAGNSDVFVAKYSAAGALVWARAMGGASSDYGQGIAVGADGSVYTTGYFQGTADFDPGSGTYNLTSAPSSSYIFVSKLDASGNFVWARTMGGAYNTYDYGYGIAVGADGGVYTTGYFQGTADFDPGSGTYNLSSGGANIYNIFVSKLDASGNFVWAHAMGGAYNIYGYGIALAADGSVYTTGCFSGTANFDPGSGWYYLTSAGVNDIFVSKLDASGNFVWARAMGGTMNDLGYGIAVGADGSVYTTGIFQGTVNFDPSSGTYNLASAGGSYDIFVSKLDAAGNFVWARAMGGTNTDQGNGIAVGSDGSVYTTGYFYGTADFDPGSGTYNLTSAGGSADIFVSKLDVSGNFLWARAMGGTSTDYSNGIAVGSDGSVFTTGYFNGTADFDPGSGTYNLTSAGGNDIFLAKFVADASTFAVGGFPSPTTAGTPGSITISAKTSSGNTATGYTGTVHFASTDPHAVLPADYTFVSGDNGVHIFAGIVFKTAGSQSIAATDTVTGTITGSQSGITVNAAAGSSLSVGGLPSPVTAGAVESVTVTAKDAYGNSAMGYHGTIHFTSSDTQAVLPANYTFTAGDLGVQTFSVILKTPGTRSVTVTDTVTSSISGTATTVVCDTAPVIDSVSITPTAPTTNQTLTADVTSHDADGDTVTYRYQWNKNGNSLTGQTASTLDLSLAGNGDKGDSITVTVTPNDGTVDGAPVTSGPVTVQNTPPTINDVPAGATIDEEAAYTFTASATDPDAPPQTLTFSLAGNIPAGASIDASTGLFTWTPTGAQGPGSYTFDVVVSDGSLTDSETITVTVADATPPTSAVQALPAMESTTSFTVAWSGQDDAGGSGLASYSVFVSDNGGAFQPWLSGVTATSAVFAGQPLHSYAFYSVARDNAGNVEDSPATPDAQTFVAAVDGTSGDDTIRLRLDPANSSLLQVFMHDPPGDVPEYGIALAALPSLTIHGLAGDDTLVVDMSYGNPIPAGGLSFDGGDGSADTLILTGTKDTDSITVSPGQVLFGTTPITLASVEKVQVGQAGADVVMGSLVVNADEALPPGAGMVLRTSSLTIADGASLDLADSTLIVDCADEAAAEDVLAMINGKTAAARNDSSGLWQGKGLTSSVARDDLDTIHGLAAIINNEGGARLVEQVGSQHPGLYSVIVKYALNGDSDLNGRIDADDYFRMDVAYRLQADGKHGGWRNGDVDYRSGISADDFYLIDQAFVRQATGMASAAKAAAAAPEPGTADVLGGGSSVLDL